MTNPNFPYEECEVETRIGAIGALTYLAINRCSDPGHQAHLNKMLALALVTLGVKEHELPNDGFRLAYLDCRAQKEIEASAAIG